VPFADYILFRHNTLPRAVVNIGGIANITCLWAAGPLDRVWAFDTGPGNCISDFLMRQLDPSGPGVDIDGQLAAEGRVVPELYELLRQDPFFVKLGPKSTDGPSMIAMYQNARRQVRRDLSLADQLATACALTVGQIARALFVFGGQFFGQMIVSGGGTRNRAVMEGLRQRLGDESIRTTDEFGIPSTAKEALAFALLAAATLDGVPSNVPSATGARRPVVLGSITPKP
jgi:anhydro-N-acetylmuramic acid kinase